MSWLARSIVNSLKLDDDDDVGDSTSVAVDSNAAKPKPVPDQSSLAQSDSSPPLMAESSPRGVKEDISELTKTLSRQFWGVASFLAPPPPAQESSDRGETAIDRDGSEEALMAGIRGDFAEIGGRFKSEISKLSKNIDVSEITKMASDFLQLGSEEESLERYESGDVVGLTEETIGFARDIAMHPETWLDFPVPDDANFEEFDISDAQQEHALAVERLAPRLAALRMELCPGYMSDGCFWKIYFVLLHPRLDKHDAELLSTPQIVEARAALMQGLPNRTKSKVEQYQSEGSTSKESVDILHEAPLGVSSDSQAEQESVKTFDIGATLPAGVIVESETEKYAVQSQEIQIVDKTVIGEGPVAQNKHAYPTVASSSRVSVENPDDEGDDWLKEETSETVGEGAKTIPITNDEDVSFSDLEDEDEDDDDDDDDNDDDGVSTSDKRVTSSSYSSTKDSRDWVQLSRTSSDSVKDVSVIGDKPATSQVSARDHETKESNDWLDIEEIM